MATTCENCPHISAIRVRMIAKSLTGGLSGIGDIAMLSMGTPDIEDLEALKAAWKRADSCIKGPVEVPTGRTVGVIHRTPEMVWQCTTDPVPTLPSSPNQTACSEWEAARREGAAVSGSETKI